MSTSRTSLSPLLLPYLLLHVAHLDPNQSAPIRAIHPPPLVLTLPHHPRHRNETETEDENETVIPHAAAPVAEPSPLPLHAPPHEDLEDPGATPLLPLLLDRTPPRHLHHATGIDTTKTGPPLPTVVVGIAPSAFLGPKVLHREDVGERGATLLHGHCRRHRHRDAEEIGRTALRFPPDPGPGPIHVNGRVHHRRRRRRCVGGGELVITSEEGGRWAGCEIAKALKL